MSKLMYGSPSYAMGASDSNSVVTKDQARASRTKMQQMKNSLEGWLLQRRINDSFVLQLTEQRMVDEAELAEMLHALLSEVFDAGQLPDPDITANPDAAVQLAAIAINGKLPGEATTAAAQGVVWMWPLVIVVGGIAFVISSAIRSKADVSKEHLRHQCIMSGKCTDTGFWFKWGAITLIGYIAITKTGLGDYLAGILGGKKKRTRR